jgi:O-antigen/teichoic acid export membrane protein
MPFTVRHLGKAQYGLWMLVASVTYYFSLLDLGYGNGVVRHIVEADTRGDTSAMNRVVSTFMCVYAAIGVAACVVCALVIAYALLHFPNLSPSDVRTAQIVLAILGGRIALGYSMTVFGAVVRKNSGRAPVGSCGRRLETILVVQSAENRLRDDSMTITNLMAAGE